MASYGGSFESEKSIEEKKLLKRQAREEILNKAKDNFEKEQRSREQKRLRGEDTWMLEDVNERLEQLDQEHSGKKKKNFKKSKKEKKKKSKKMKLKKNEESCDSSSDSEDEWVESTLETHNAGKAWKVKEQQQLEEKEDSSDVKRDEWMTLDFMSIKATSTASVRAEKQKLKIVEQEKAELLEKSQLQARELNPYWKDGGSGLPSEESEATSATKASLVEDGGLSWLQKSYQRMKEQSEREQRDLDEIIAARYGSVKVFQNKMEEAKKTASVYYAKEHEARREKWRKLKYSDTDFDKKVKRERNMDSKEQDKGDRDRNFYKDSSRYQDRKASQDKHRQYPRERLRDDGKETENTESEPRDSSSSLAVKASNPLRSQKKIPSYSSFKCNFLKPSDDDDETISGTRDQICELQRSSSLSRSLPRNSFRKPQNESEDAPPWRKAQAKEGKEQEQLNENPTVSPQIIANLEETAKNERCEPQREHLTDSPDNRSLLTDHKPLSSRHESDDEPTQILSEEEMNKLGAKIVKAELMGNMDLASNLKEQLEKARQQRERQTQIPLLTKKTETEPRSLQEDHEVLLVRTDQSGRAWPVNAMTQPPEPKGGRRKRQMITTHVDKERVRYYQDDDNQTLQDLVKKEKMGTAEDQSRLFMRMASKFMEKTDKEYYTLDDMFVSKAAKKESTNREEERERQQAIFEHRKLLANMEKCPYCFDNAELPKHLIIAIGVKVYLCLPNSLSLTEGHCLIAPLQHHTAATFLDEDIWEEVQLFRKALVKMFEAKGLDCVFLETNMDMKKRYHMLYECIPLPKEVGDMAPIYFKKAIMESDEEWSMNKKLIDLSSRDIRKSVPKGLPYFSVNFGLQGGYAHVIEDKYKFPHYFGKEIVGGMLDLEPRRWRKAIRENFDDQRKKVLQFAQWWKPYDFTKTKQ
ncbi:CWF19-like protein 2 [Microcaecilia unicolor]|uniref:CWF19-like protein 2 n=1 Tax=Microcaecilia unicolor TaxID=1415580 RepID=A0A6P7XST8_9AMPH|nr:CWF19-like protein 2 [Microcaecilia unicolor]XP_030056117.1 CWF19-like protein 2 [Microcaecilia unicolor]